MLLRFYQLPGKFTSISRRGLHVPSPPLSDPSTTPTSQDFEIYFSKKAFLCEKRLRNYKTLKNSFHVPAPPYPTPHPSPDKILKRIF
jgi:hypothetical protein